MAFRFRLDTLRRLRGSLEKREKLRLMLLTGRMAQLQQMIASLESERRGARQQFEQQLAVGMLSGEVRFATAVEAVRDLRRTHLLLQAEDMEKQCQAQQVAYINARRAHELLVLLRGRAWDLYQLKERRREQQRLDELHLQTCTAPPTS